MSKLSQKVGVLAVLESTPGTDPGSGYSGVLINKDGFDIKPTGEKIERNFLTTSLSPQGHVIGAKTYELTFQAELKGGGLSGSDVVAPELDVMLQACAMKKEDLLVLSLSSVSGNFEVGEEIIDTTASSASLGYLADVVTSGSSATLYIHAYTGQAVTSGDTITGATSSASGTAGSSQEGLCYHPVSSEADMKTATIHCYRDGIRHVITYCMGTFDLNMQVGSYPIASFSMSGVYSDPTDESDPSVSYSDITPPLVLNAGLQIGDVDMSLTCATALSVGLKNTVSPRKCINSADGVAGFRITSRAPAGSIDPEATDIASFNPWEKWKSAGTEKIYCNIGSQAGNTIRPLVPYALYDSVSYGNRDGLLTYELPFICKGGPSGGDDEFWLFFT